jgi:hypothetical protein
MYIENFEDIPKDAMAVINKEWGEYCEGGEVTTMEEVLESIREGYEDYEESTSSDYITCTYYTERDGWRFEVDGNSYRKDQCVCDQEMDDGFTLINLNAQKKAKEKAKNAKRAKSDEDWRTLFSSVEESITPEAAFELLKDYKFPTKWKQNA